MAVVRKAPKCYLCGESYKGIYSKRSKTFVGDSFVRWDTDGHKCIREGTVYFIENVETREWYRVLGLWTKDPLRCKFFKDKTKAEEFIEEHKAAQLYVPFPPSIVTEHIFG